MEKSELYSLLVGNKKKNSTKIAIKNNRFSISYAEFDDEIHKYSRILKKHGASSGCKIGVMIKDHAAFLTILMAGILLEATVVPIYVNISDEKIQNIIAELNINILISEKILHEQFAEQFHCMQKGLYLYLGVEPQNDIDKDIIMIMQTSGTTNKSKGVMLSTANISSNIKGICEYLKLVESDIILIIKNTNHISTIVGEMLVALYAGVSMVFSENVIRMNHLVNVINEYNITIFFTVPSLLHNMLEKEEPIKECLRTVNFYGAKISNTDIKSLLKKFLKINFIYSYGQTEASPRVTYIERVDMEKHLGSSGKTIEGVEITIQDEQGIEVKPYEEGEIVVFGCNVMRGYYNNQSLTERVLKNGYLYTGDLGYVNDSGYLYVTGRKDNMIIISGKNIHPEEVEEVITEYPGVSEAMVEEKQYGGIAGLVCYVVKVENHIINPKDILYYARSRVEDYKIPREILFVTELEKTASGKIKRNYAVSKK